MDFSKVKLSDAKLPYSGPEWEACKKYFDEVFLKRRNLESDGDQATDMWFDEIYEVWNDALRWKDSQQFKVGSNDDSIG